MDRIELKKKRLTNRRRGIRARIMGTPERPRLAVFRSLRHVYAQVIDDLSGRTLASASTRDKAGAKSKGGNCAAASAVGTALAERARQAGVERVVFDRSGRKYHGRIKALAEAVRKGGLEF
jgi:large subunit ribosomal protein L18